MLRLITNAPILMLDDDVIDLQVATRCHRLSGLTNPLLTFRSSEAFFEYIDDVEAGREPMPALVLMDIRMPGHDGFQVTGMLRQRPRFDASPPVVMLTTSTLERDRALADEHGCAGYHVKPDNFDSYTAFFRGLAG